MAEHRNYPRVECDKKSLLNVRDLHYFATVKNISEGGALVQCRWRNPNIRIGDACTIIVDEETAHEYSCEVVRIEAANVALKFAGMHESEVVECKFF